MTEVPRWYTREDLAERWHVAAKTISNWLSIARAEGWGPTRDEYLRQHDPKGGCVFIMRADYAIKLHARMRMRKSLSSR